MAKNLLSVNVGKYTLSVKENGFFKKRRKGSLYSLEITEGKKLVVDQKLGNYITGDSFLQVQRDNSVFIKAVEKYQKSYFDEFYEYEMGGEDSYDDIYVHEFDLDSGKIVNTRHITSGMKDGRKEANYMLRQLVNGTEFDKTLPLPSKEERLEREKEQDERRKAAQQEMQNQPEQEQDLGRSM